MITIPPVLASDTTGAAIFLLLLLLALAVFGLGGVWLNSTRFGRRKWWGLVIGLIPTLLGGFFLFYLMTITGGAPCIALFIAACPLICGLVSLYQWSGMSEM